MYMKDSDGNVQKVGFTNEVDRSKWKLLGETEITQEMIDEAGEEGITAIVLEFDPIEKWYGETWIRAEFGATKDLNNEDGSVLCSFGKTLEYALQYHDGAAGIMRAQTAVNAPFYRNYWNKINLFTNWHDNKARGTIFYSNGFSARNYPLPAYATANTDNTSVIGNRYLVFRSNGGRFKFPAGTTLKLYGRF